MNRQQRRSSGERASSSGALPGAANLLVKAGLSQIALEMVGAMQAVVHADELGLTEEQVAIADRVGTRYVEAWLKRNGGTLPGGFRYVDQPPGSVS